MTLQCTLKLPCALPWPRKDELVRPNLFAYGTRLSSQRSRAIKIRTNDLGRARGNKLRTQASLRSTDSEQDEDDDEDDGQRINDPFSMSEEERVEWRKAIREMLKKTPDVAEELDPSEKSKKVQELMAQYPLVVEEDDPNWPEDSEGWGFNFSQFFDKITIKNDPKEDADDNDDDDPEDEIVWQDDNFIRPVKDIKTADWEETVFKDISPLIVLVHNRYRRPKENEKVLEEVVKAVQIIWNCRLPSPRCVAVDAVVETDLVSALQVSVFPELIFTKAGKILYREKEIRTADELSKIMAYFYYGAAKPPCLTVNGDSQESVPSVSVSVSVDYQS